MSIVQKHEDFYVVLSHEAIKIVTKHGMSSCYPVWLGKNRAIMRDAIKYFKKHEPQTIIDCLSIVGHFNLNGLGNYDEIDDSNFLKKSEKDLDNEKIFW